MKETEIEKLRQLVSRTDMSGNQKVDWLVNFINEREQALRIYDVVAVGQSEQLKCGNQNPPCAPNLKFGMLECCQCNWSE